MNSKPDVNLPWTQFWSDPKNPPAFKSRWISGLELERREHVAGMIKERRQKALVKKAAAVSLASSTNL